jgi:hypothetical protein
VAHIGERAFDDVGRAQMLPVLGREVVEGEQRTAILDQALDRLVVFEAPDLDKGPQCLLVVIGATPEGKKELVGPGRSCSST